MRTAPSKRDPVRLSLARLGLMALFLAVILVAMGVYDVFKKERESAALRSQAEAQLADLSEQQTHLIEELSNLKTDRGKEETLREHYEIGRSGERLVVIVDPTAQQPVEASSSIMKVFQRALSWW